jgi:hypothetical protein
LDDLENYEKDMISYSAYRIISEYKKISQKSPSGLFFNNAISLLNTLLKQSNIDIKLPHCWYRWGDEVVRYYMPPEIQWTHEESYYTKVEWNGNYPNTLSESSKKERIDCIIDDIISKYSIDKNSLEQLVNEVYKAAPLEFQKRYKDVRDLLGSQKLFNSSQIRDVKDVLINALNRALQSFPDSPHFDNVRKLIPAFKELVVTFLNLNNAHFELINDMIEEYWFWFCYYLRTYGDANDNIPKSTILYWDEIKSVQDEIYYTNFRDYLLKLYKVNQKIIDNDVLNPFVQSALRNEAELDKTVEELGDVFSDLGSFLKDIKRGYNPRHFGDRDKN